MAITFVAATEATSATATVTINVPSGVLDGDLLLLVCVQSDGEDGSWNSLSGWTEEVVDAVAGGSAPSSPECSVFSRIASSEPASYAPSVDNPAGVGTVAKMMAFRNPDAATPMDQTPTTATGSGNATPDPPSITTQTPGAFVVAIGFMDDDLATLAGVPTGYTDPDGLGIITTAGGGNGCSLGVAYNEIASAGPEDPSAFNFSDSDEWGAISVALRPGGGPSVTSIDVDDDVDDGQTDVIIGGLNFLDQGTDSKVEFGTHQNYDDTDQILVEQTGINFWNETDGTISIDVSAVDALGGPGNYYVFVTDALGQTNTFGHLFALHRAHAFRMSPSGNVSTDGDPTTRQLTLPAGKDDTDHFAGGRLEAIDNPVQVPIGDPWPTDAVREDEFCIEAVDAAEVDTEGDYEFRLVYDGEPALPLTDFPNPIISITAFVATSASTSASSTKSTTKSTSRSSSASTTRSSSVSTTRSTSASTTRSSSVSTTRSSSASTTRSSSASTTRSSSVSTTRSSSVSTTRSSSVSTTRSSSVSTTRSSSVSTSASSTRSTSATSFVPPADEVILIRDTATISDIDGDGSEVTVQLSATFPNSNLKVGQDIRIFGTTSYNGVFTITVVDSQTQFRYADTVTGSETGSAGGHYTNLVAAEAGEQQDVTLIGAHLVFELYDDFPNGMTETAQVRFETADWTTDRSSFIVIRSAPEDIGSPWIEHDGPTVRINGVTFPADGTTHGIIHFDDDLDFFLQDFEIDGTEDTDHSGHVDEYAGVTFRGGVGGGSFLMENMRIHGFQGTGAQRDCVRMMCTGFDTLYQWRNVALYDVDDEGVQMDADGGSASAVDDWHPNSFWDHGICHAITDIGIAVALNNSNASFRNVYSSSVDINFDDRATNRILQGYGCASEDTTASTLPGGGGSNPTNVDPVEHLSDPDNGDFRLINRTDGNLLSNQGSSFDLGMTDFGGDLLDQMGHGSELDINGDLWGTDRDIGIFSFSPFVPTSASTTRSSSVSTTKSTSASVTASSASSSVSTTRSSSVSTTKSTSASTTATDSPFFGTTDCVYTEIDSGDLSSGGTQHPESSGLCYAPDRDYIVSVSDDLFIREFERVGFTPVQSDVALGNGMLDVEGICWIGDWFTDFDYAILDEGASGGALTRIHLVPFAAGQTSTPTGVVTFSLPDIPRHTGTYSGEGCEGLAYDPNKDLFYVSNQADTESDAGIWEVNLNVLNTDGFPTQRFLYDYTTAGIVNGAAPSPPSPVAFSDLFHGAQMGSARPDGPFNRSLFLLTRDTTASRRLVIQLDTESGAIISVFTHAEAAQVEGVCFDTLSSRGDMFLSKEEASGGTPNVFRYSCLGPVTTSASTTKSTSVSTTRSSSASTTRSSSVSTTRSSSVSTTRSSSVSTTRSSSVSTTRSSSVSTTRSSSVSTTRSSSVSTTKSTTKSTTRSSSVSTTRSSSVSTTRSSSVSTTQFTSNSTTRST